MKIVKRKAIALGMTLCLSAFASVVQTGGAMAAEAPMPTLVNRDGKFALNVDGAPFFVLGAQANNSSNYAGALPKVWPAIKDMSANTLVMPVAWEQIEPTEGKFDFSFVDTLLEQARKNDVRVGLLWFGTWKNTGPNYTPNWVKLNNKRFPRVLKKDGTMLPILSAASLETREADKKAYIALLTHLKKVDPQHTVIMVQVQNEVGVYGSSRDFSPAAEAEFQRQVPEALLKRMGKAPGTWTEVFGADADEYFQAWSIAAYCDDIAKAGKAVLPLPTYMNAALRHVFKNEAPGTYASGGPTYNVLDIYKAAAPNIDFLVPDIYSPESLIYEANLDHYARPDNPLFVGEMGNAPVYAHYLYSVIGHGGIGFDPFGMDYTGFTNFPLGGDPKTFGPEEMKPFATLYQAFAPMQRLWAKAISEGRAWGVSEGDDHGPANLTLGNQWTAKVEYRLWPFGGQAWTTQLGAGLPEGSETPRGGVSIAQIDDTSFYVVGQHARITFGTGIADQPMMLDRVEEGHFDQNGNWVFERVQNGDQTDFGLNFTDKPVVLKVRLGIIQR